MKELMLDAFLQYTIPHSLSCSPDGKLALIASRPLAETNSYEHTLYVTEGRSAIRELFAMGNAKWFQWYDENQILVPKSIAPGNTVLMTISADDGHITNEFAALPIAVQNMKRIRDTWYAAVASIDSHYPDYYKMTAEDRKLFDEAAKFEKDYQVIDELPYYVNGGTYTNKKRNAIFIVNLATGECRRITDPLFQTGSYCVIDRVLYYTGEKFEHKSKLTNDIWKYDLSSDSNVCLYNKQEYNMGNGISTDGGGIFAWGDRLMLLANKNTFYDRRLHKTFYTVDKENGEISVLCDYPYCTTSIVVTDLMYGSAEAFVPDGDMLYFRSTLNNECKLAALAPDGTVHVVAENGGNVSCVAAHDGKIYCACSCEQELPECYEVLPDGTFKPISSLNAGILGDYYVAVPQPLSFEIHGHQIDGFVMLPKDYDSKKSYPGILHIHGGPNAVFGTVFYHEAQFWANKGYFVFFCNPEGSEGHGDSFLKIAGRFGKEDYETLMRFTDIVLERYPAMDKSRLCVTGGSYGGFMTNWIIGHTDRFVCAVSQRSISNWLTMQTISDIGYHFAKDMMRGSLEKDLDKMWEQSPLRYAPQVKTPTLFLQSDTDYRTPVDQALQMYGALKDYGVDTRLCIFHGENHGLNRAGKPLHRVRRLQEITDWFEKYAK